MKGTLIRVWSTLNRSKIAELRRGVDPAIIFSVAISPSNTFLAVTSDKSTLHFFDLSQFTQAASQPPAQRLNIPGFPNIPTSAANSSASKTYDVMSSSSATANTTSSKPISTGDPEAARKQKWGLLGKIPLMPRVFSDTYSFASVPFVIGGEPTPTSSRKSASTPYSPSATISPTASSWRPGKFNDWDTDSDADFPIAAAATAATAATAAAAAMPSHHSVSSSAVSAATHSINAASLTSNIPGSPSGKSPKGQIGWLSDEQLVVVGAGLDSRWERFRIGVTDDGTRICYREGWKRYLDD